MFDHSTITAVTNFMQRMKAHSKPRAPARSATDAAEKKLKRLVEVLLGGSVIPFLGAGISLPSKHIRFKQWAGHSIDAMRNSICEGMAEVHKGPLDDSYHRKVCDECREVRKMTCTPKVAGKLWPPFGRCCELFLETQSGSWPERYLALCNKLEIPEFLHLAPTLAHRCIAFLSREGLIHEVITTNYDCCLERALYESFGWDFDKADHNQADRNPPGVYCAFDLDTYRSKAGRNRAARDPHTGQRLTSLKIYKINGCAAELFECMENHAEKILLTDRQLQDWRERAWARDMFRDRLRRANLVFCGFGSDEPQVRHTLGLVMEEFGNRDSHDRNESSPISLFERENFLMVNGYSRTPSPIQWQALTAYRDAHVPERAVDGEEAERLALGLFIGPNDTGAFRWPAPDEWPRDENLSADAFWCEVYSRAVASLLVVAVKPRYSIIAHELGACLPHAHELLTDFHDRISNESGDESSLLAALLSWDTARKLPRLTTWLDALWTAGPACVDGQALTDRRLYLPIRDHEALAAKLMLLMAGLGAVDGNIPEPEIEPTEGGLRLTSTTGKPNPGEVTLHLSADWESRFDRKLIEPTNGDGQAPRERQVGQRHLSLVLSPLPAPPRDASGRRNGISFPVSLADLLRRDGRQVRTVEQFGELLQRVAWAPTHPYRGQQRARRHGRLRRIEV